MRFLLITNPTSGTGRGANVGRRLAAELARSGVNVEHVFTTARYHARQLASHVTSDIDAVVAVGGDGTVHEVGCGLIESGARVPLGVVPAGSGNDFSRALGVTAHEEGVAHYLLNAAVDLIDVGHIAWHSHSESGESVFLNAVGCGFDALVAANATRIRHLRGYPRYLVAILKTLRHWKAPHVTVHFEGDHHEEQVWEGPLLLCTAGNGVSSGGGFMLTPRAVLDDGLLDMCLVRDMSFRRILTVLPLAIRGTHLSQREVVSDVVEKITIESETGFPVHLDGEIVSDAVLRVHIEARAGRLLVLRPPST